MAQPIGATASAPTDQRPDMVVIVRDISTVGTTRIAEVIRESGACAGMVTGAEADDTRQRLERAMDKVVEVDDPTDAAAVTGALQRIAVEYRPVAVLASSDGCIPAAATAAESMGIGRTPAAPIVTARNKFAARDVYRAAGLPVPGYALLDSVEGAEQVAATVGLPAIVKPVSGTGSHLVTVVNSVSELAAAYRHATQKLPVGELGHLYRQTLHHDGRSIDVAQTVLVESMLSGREYCVDFIIRDGVIEQLPLVDKFLMDEQFFELGFATPPLNTPQQQQDAVCSAAYEAVRALGLDNTLAHVEVIDDARLGPTVVEVNPGRPGGPGPSMLYRVGLGMDTTVEVAAVQRGLESPRRRGGVGIPLASMCLYAEETGRLKAVHGIAEIEQHPDVVAVAQTVQPGDPLTNEREVIIATIVVAGFEDEDDLIKTYHEFAGKVWLERE